MKKHIKSLLFMSFIIGFGQMNASFGAAKYNAVIINNTGSPIGLSVAMTRSESKQLNNPGHAQLINPGSTLTIGLLDNSADQTLWYKVNTQSVASVKFSLNEKNNTEAYLYIKPHYTLTTTNPNATVGHLAELRI